MIGTIRKHQTWLWVVITVVTVISFVVFFNPGARNGNSSGGGNFGMLAGKPISQAQFVEAKKEVLLGYFLQNQQWPSADGNEVTRATYQRLFLIQKQKDLGIQISTEAVATVARRMLGSGSLDEFADKVLKQGGLDANDFDHFLRHELGTEQLMKVAGMSGELVTPQEADTLYRLEHQDVDSSMVFFSASNMLANVKATPEEIGKFYTNQMANYRIPDQVQVEYVKFPITNYIPSATAALTNINQMVDSAVKQLGTNLFHNTKTPAESREAVRQTIIRHQALVDARRAANTFGEQLDAMTPRSAANINVLAASNHMQVGTTAPFDRQFGPSPSEMIVSPDFTRKAFQLTTNDPFAGPILPDEEHPADGVYVIALKNRLPSHIPSFDSIKDKVTSDYRYMQAMQMAQQAAVRFHGQATNELAAGKSFNSICSQAGVRPESLPAFNVSTRSLPESIEQKVSFGLLKQIAFSTPAGHVGPPAGARDGAFVLYIAKLLPVDEAKMKQEFPMFLAMVRQGRQSDAFNQWFNVQLNRDPDFVQVLRQLSEQNQGQSGRSASRPRS